MKKIGTVGELINAIFPYPAETQVDLETEGPVERTLMPWSGEIEEIVGKGRIVLKCLLQSELQTLEDEEKKR